MWKVNIDTSFVLKLNLTLKIFVYYFCVKNLDGEVRFNPTDLHAANYHVMGVDLRNIDEVENKLKQAEVDFTIPTIILAECVLVYIETDNCSRLLSWFSSHFSSALFVNYEQVNLKFQYNKEIKAEIKLRKSYYA